MTCEDEADACETNVASAMTETFPSRCEAAKRKAAGKLASGELGCYSKAAAKGAALDSGCISKATGKFSAALGKAGACPDGGSPQMLVENDCVRPAVTTDGGGMVTDVCPTTTTTSAATTSTTASSTTTTSTTATTTTTANPCGPGQMCHDHCTVGPAQCPACSACAAAVCDPFQDPSCCDPSNGWTALCVSESELACNMTCP